MANIIIPSFAKGELSPGLYGRVDTAAYSVGLRTARNCIVRATGGISNRAGTVFIGVVKDHTNPPVLIPFEFKTDDEYILEFGNLYMRVIRNDGVVTDATVNITAATQADPVVVTAAGHGLSNGDEIFLDEVVGMTEINNRRFIVQGVSGATFQLTDQVDGTDIGGTGFTAYSSGGFIGKIFEIATPYLAADLLEIAYVQSADVMTLSHRNYEQRDLARTAHNAWTLTVNTFEPEIADPTALTLASNGADNSITYRYKVTAISSDNPSEESLAGVDNTSMTITGITQANPAVVTSASHGLSNGDEVELAAVVGMTEVNGRRFVAQNVAANTFELEGEDSSGYTAYSSAGTARRTFVEITNGTTIPDNTVAWAAVTDAVKYAVYRRDNGIYGLVGETELLTYTEDNSAEVIPALTVSPPRARNPFLFADNYPGTSSYYEQRQVSGGSVNSPDTSYYSQTGRRKNMSTSIPIQADDAITTVMRANKVNEIRHFVPSDDLVVLTSGSEWKVSAGLDVGFSFSTIQQKPQSQWGSDYLQPIIAGTTIIFLEEGKSRVQGLDKSGGGKYEATELSELSSHLVEGFTLVSWAFEKAPSQRLYAARSDGQMLTMAYNRNQEVVGWTRWDTKGKFERVARLRKGTSTTEDGMYFVVKRKVNGNTVRYIERQHSRRFTDVRDAFFVDCGLTADVPLTITGITQADPVVVTATAHGFTHSDEIDIHDVEFATTLDANFTVVISDQINKRRYYAADITANTFALVTNEAPLPITAVNQANPAVVTSASHGLSNGDIVGIFFVSGMTELNGITYTVANAATDTFELAGIDSAAFTAYTVGGEVFPAEDGTSHAAYVEAGKARKAFSTVTQLNYLEGEAAAVLADGNVVDGLTVTNGAITLPFKASRVHVGLRYIADIELLNIEAPDGTIQGLLQNITDVTLRMEKSRGLLVGPNETLLTELKQREFEKLGEPTELLTGDISVSLHAEWATNGRLFMRQKDPLPTTLLAAIPNLEVEDG